MHQQDGLDDLGYIQYLTWLCEHLALLASRASNQENYLRAIGTWDCLDELGLEWDDYYDVLKGQEKFSKETLGVFEAVSGALDQVPKSDWIGRAALAQPAWNLVRQAAERALPAATPLLYALVPGCQLRCPGNQLDGKTFIGTHSTSLLPERGREG